MRPLRGSIYVAAGPHHRGGKLKIPTIASFPVVPPLGPPSLTGIVNAYLGRS